MTGGSNCNALICRAGRDGPQCALVRQTGRDGPQWALVQLLRLFHGLFNKLKKLIDKLTRENFAWTVRPDNLPRGSF